MVPFIALWIVACGGGPDLEAVDAVTLPVPTATGLPPITGFTVNTRVHPHGLPGQWHVEYGPTTAYGTQTAPRALPPRLDAHYAEDWADGIGAWKAGFSGEQLQAFAEGGPDGGPFVRYTDDQGAGDDVNHLDGIGLIHLGPYFYPGNYYWAEIPPLYLGGGFPDLRGAAMSASLRGVGWDRRGTSLGTWIQAYRDPTVVEVLPEDSRYPNWAFTGAPLVDHLASGAWEEARWTLRERTADWTFAGSYGGRLLYDYGELDVALRGVNVDVFLLQILGVDLVDQPSGSFDVARFEMTYRQHSLCAPSNGGALAVEPPGGTGAAFLTDGWRNGAGREWQSAPAPTAPQVFEVAFETPVTITSVNVHNATVNPSRHVEVAVSEDGGRTWFSVADGTLPDTSPYGPNALFVHADAWVLDDAGVAVWAPLHPAPVDRMRVRVLSGWQSDRWGLGEIEAFGTGNVQQTDDAWVDLTQDVRVEPGTWHFRVVATTDAGTTRGVDQTILVPPAPSSAR